MVQLYGPMVFRWCRRMGLDTFDADDAGQDVFLAVARNVKTFRKDSAGQTFRGWLFTITRSKVIDNFRRRRANPKPQGGSDARENLEQVPDPDSIALPNSISDDASLQHAEHSAVRRAAALVREEFSENHWQAFWRTTIDGESPEIAAQQLGVSLNVVYLARSRILRRLREMLGDADE